MAITRSVLLVARNCAVLALIPLLIAGCGTIQPSPTRMTVLHNDKMIVFGRIQVVENGQLQTAALGKGFRPIVYFSTRDRTIMPFGDDTYFVETEAEGYFFVVLPALSYRLRLSLHSQFTEYDSEQQNFEIYPGIQLPRAAPGEVHYVGTLRIENQITGKKGTFYPGPKVCQLVNVGILNESAVAESEFRRRFPLDAHLTMSNALLERNPDLLQGMFYQVNGTPTNQALEGPATLLLWPILIPMSVAAGIEHQSVWKGPDQECQRQFDDRANPLWPEVESRKRSK